MRIPLTCLSLITVASLTSGRRCRISGSNGALTSTTTTTTTSARTDSTTETTTSTTEPAASSTTSSITSSATSSVPTGYQLTAENTASESALGSGLQIKSGVEAVFNPSVGGYSFAEAYLEPGTGHLMANGFYLSYDIETEAVKASSAAQMDAPDSQAYIQCPVFNENEAITCNVPGHLTTAIFYVLHAASSDIILYLSSTTLDPEAGYDSVDLVLGSS